MAYASYEKETSCVYDYEARAWNIYSCVPSHMTKLNRLGEPYWKEEEPGKDGTMRMIAGKWKLGAKQVRFAKLFVKKEDGAQNEEVEVDEMDDEDEQEIA